MLHACRNAFFHCLLFNSSLNSPEFKFELNMFESISKKMQNLSPSPWFSAQPNQTPSPSPFSFSFSLPSFPPLGPNQPPQLPFSRPSPSPPPSLTSRWDPPSRLFLPRPCASRTLLRVRSCHAAPPAPFPWRARQDSRPPLFKAPAPPREPYRAQVAAAAALLRKP